MSRGGHRGAGAGRRRAREDGTAAATSTGGGSRSLRACPPTGSCRWGTRTASLPHDTTPRRVPVVLDRVVRATVQVLGDFGPAARGGARGRQRRQGEFLTAVYGHRCHRRAPKPRCGPPQAAAGRGLGPSAPGATPVPQPRRYPRSLERGLGHRRARVRSAEELDPARAGIGSGRGAGGGNSAAEAGVGGRTDSHTWHGAAAASPPPRVTKGSS